MENFPFSTPITSATVALLDTFNHTLPQTEQLVDREGESFTPDEAYWTSLLRSISDSGGAGDWQQLFEAALGGDASILFQAHVLEAAAQAYNSDPGAWTRMLAWIQAH